ncbi:MAG: hypothetical protein KF812_06825 [Fimbriimonadaceae bacterium]|nr:hypothetical protein [Fimbriimonadaceae bacterium]
MPLRSASALALAERLLVLTALLSDAIRTDRFDALEAILDERGHVVEDLSLAPISAEASAVLQQVAQEEQLAFELLAAARDAARQQIQVHQTVRRGLKGYRSAGETGFRRSA